MGDTKEKPEVSIVVLSYNHWDHTSAALNSLTITEDVSFDTILIDNGSDPLTQKEITEYRNDIINYQYVLNDTNKGISSGRNQGASLAKGKYILFLDNDVEIIDSRWLTTLLDGINRDDTIGIAGGLLLKPSGEPQFAGGKIDSKGKVSFSEELNIDNNLINNTISTEFCIGACMLVSKAIWDKLGGFDTLFDPLDYEDIDFCLRAAEMGKKCVIFPNVKLVHKAHVTTGSDGLSNFKRLQNYLINGRRFRR